MATLAFTEVSSPKEDGLADSRRDHSAEFWAPTLAPVETPAHSDARAPVRQPALYADEDLPQHFEQSDLSASETSFGSGRKLVAGAAVLAALGMCALAYFFVKSPSEKAFTQTAEISLAIQSPSATPVQAAISTSERSPAAPATAARPDAPASIAPARPPQPVEASPQFIPPAAPGSSATRQPVPASQNRDALFLQRPGVNIRSTPSVTGSILGTAAKGTRLEVTNREGDWVQVESGRVKGWVNARFLGPSEPR
jgi:hypothetical protein